MKSLVVPPQADGQSTLPLALSMRWISAVAMMAVAVTIAVTIASVCWAGQDSEEQEGTEKKGEATPSAGSTGSVVTVVSREEIAASEDLSSPFALPSPVDWFRVFEKLGSPRWRQFYRDSGSFTITNRHKAALVLGVTLTDAYVAVESRGSQEVRNVLADLRSLEKTLGISERMQQRNTRLGELADAEQWQALRVELEATMKEQKNALREQRDGDLAELLSFGLLLRTIAVNCEIVRDLELEDRLCIGDTTLIFGMIKRVESLPQDSLKERAVRDLRRCLKAVRDCWAVEPPDADVDRVAVTQKSVQEFLSSLLVNE